VGLWVRGAWGHPKVRWCLTNLLPEDAPRHVYSPRTVLLGVVLRGQSTGEHLEAGGRSALGSWSPNVGGIYLINLGVHNNAALQFIRPDRDRTLDGKSGRSPTPIRISLTGFQVEDCPQFFYKKIARRSDSF